MKTFKDFKKALKDESRWMIHKHHNQTMYYAKIVYVKKTYFILEELNGKRHIEYFWSQKGYTFTSNGKTAEVFIKNQPFISYTKVAKKLPKI